MKLSTAETERVNGLSFFSKKPWILASLHSGVIELWDYRTLTVIQTFNGHYGPVFGLHLHKSQLLFVSGGDDYKIKVWDLELGRCLFTLFGHLGCVRTVQFHHEHPWIVSASDDRTIRIWNWQSRNCISVLAGHSHYVMCASFHPKEDLLVSSSFDKTVRVWDISALKKKSAATMVDTLHLGHVNSDLLGAVGVVVKYVFEGHECGVKWASFHPSLPLIVSGGDDYQVKVWRLDGTKARVHTLRGHINNVSCVLWAKQDIILSISEDGSTRAWDSTTGAFLQDLTIGKRFWILAAHPLMSLFAAGNDGGFTVFKLERWRPAFSVVGDSLYYVKDGFFHTCKYSTQTDTPVVQVGWTGSLFVVERYKTLSYSPTENAVLVCSKKDVYALFRYVVPKDSSGGVGYAYKQDNGNGRSAVFVAPNRFAVLDKNTNQVLVKNLQNEVVKSSDLPIVVNAMFYAGNGNLLCTAEDRVVIFYLQKGLVFRALETPFVRHVVWSDGMENVALLSKHSIVMANKKLVHQCTLHERVHVKSGAWDENGVFVYSTLDHIKYCLPNGESGIIKTLDMPLYITKVNNNIIHYLDCDGKNYSFSIDSTEYVIKLSVLKKKEKQVMSTVRGSDLCGQALVAYLKQHGFHEAALHLERKRFNLAPEIGDNDRWHRLGAEALHRGYVWIAGYAYRQAKNLPRASFLCLVTGNLDKLSKMFKIFQHTNDVMGQFQNALYLGDVVERVEILRKAGHLPLAYVTASVHGLGETAQLLAAELGGNVPSVSAVNSRSRVLLVPPTPITLSGDWPLLQKQTIFSNLSSGRG